MSKACWPACARSSLATDVAAQRHRRFILLYTRVLDLFGVVRLCFQARRRRFLKGAHVYSLAMVGLGMAVVVVLSRFCSWTTLAVLAVLCLVTTLVITQLVFPESGEGEQRRTALPAQPHMQFEAQPTPPPIMQPFPDTPMPAPSLIRVLETIDLSSTNIEHFLTINNQECSEEKECLSQAQRRGPFGA